MPHAREAHVYVHHAATEAEARELLARDVPNCPVLFLECIDRGAGKWHAVIKSQENI